MISKITGYLCRNYCGIMETATTTGYDEALTIAWSYCCDGLFTEIVTDDETKRYNPDLLDEITIDICELLCYDEHAKGKGKAQRTTDQS